MILNNSSIIISAISISYTRGDKLKDVINQIIQIDKFAFEKQEFNANELLKLKQAYEKDINLYKKEKLSISNHNAESIIENLNSALNDEEEMQKNTMLEIKEGFDKQYKDAKDLLIEKLFTKFFLLEE